MSNDEKGFRKDEFEKNYNREAERINREICKSWGLPYPFSQLTTKLDSAFQEALNRAVLAEYCLENHLPWYLYKELRGHLLAKRDTQE